MSDDTDDGDRWPVRAARFLTANRRRFATDLVVVAAWTVLLLGVVTRLGWPRWVYYPVLLAGVLAYTLTVGSWRGPDERR
jgi:hypothetical protein